MQLRALETESIQARTFPEGELRFVELLRDAVTRVHEITSRFGRKHRNTDAVDPRLADKLTRQLFRHLERLRRLRLTRGQICRHRRDTFPSWAPPISYVHQLYCGRASFKRHVPPEHPCGSGGNT